MRVRVRVREPNTPNTDCRQATNSGVLICVGLHQPTQHQLNTPNTLTGVIMLRPS